MSKKLMALGLVFLIVFALNGCYSDNPPPENETAAEVPISSFSESTETHIEPDTSEETEYSKVITETETTTVPQKTENPKSGGTEKQNNQTQTQKQNEEKPISPTQSKPIETKQAEQPTTAPKSQETTEQPKQETKTESEPKFDVSSYVEYAKGYAQSIGLSLDSTAVDCWDNPINANAENQNIKSDIQSRLNRYKNVEGFTSVWVWAEKVSATQYEIYIGYA